MMSPPAKKLKAACKIAGVKPTTRELNGEDPKAFVISATIYRRHLTKGQRAIAVAMVYPNPEKLKRGGSSVSEQQGIPKDSPSRPRRGSIGVSATDGGENDTSRIYIRDE